MESHLSSGSMNIVNMNDDNVSSCSLPLWIGIVGVLPCSVVEYVPEDPLEVCVGCVYVFLG